MAKIAAKTIKISRTSKTNDIIKMQEFVEKIKLIYLTL